MKKVELFEKMELAKGKREVIDLVKLYFSELGEIYDRADSIEIEKEYQNFKKMVNKQIQKRRIKNIVRWLGMMRDYRDEIMVLYIEKYLKEEIDKD